MKPRKILLRILCFILLAMLVGTWALFGPLVKGALSVKQLDDRIYYMEYRGDDGFDGLLEAGGGSNASEISNYIIRFLSKGFSKQSIPLPETNPYGCSAFTVRDEEGRFLTGRNFDYYETVPMILHSRPRHGYESISTFDMRLLGFGDDWRPDSFANKYMALTNIFLALDGINEKGLAVADLVAGDDVETHQDRGKPDLTTTSALQYILNRTATVDEALELLESIDMHSDIGIAHHYSISDATGRSVVVEYIDGEMVATDTPIVTNHYLAPAKYLVGLKPNDHRYDTLEDEYVECLGIFDSDGLCEAMQSVTQTPSESFGGTQWTVLWDLEGRTATYFFWRNYDKAYRFAIRHK